MHSLYNTVLKLIDNQPRLIITTRLHFCILSDCFVVMINYDYDCVSYLAR